MPAGRNHLDATGVDTPTSAPAASLVRPWAINRQNARWTARDGSGRPGERIAGRNARSAAHCRRPPGDQSFGLCMRYEALQARPSGTTGIHAKGCHARAKRPPTFVGADSSAHQPDLWGELNQSLSGPLDGRCEPELAECPQGVLVRPRRRTVRPTG